MNPGAINTRSTKQRGVVLFFALVALLAMSLAAVALIRSVDTSTMIAGNLAFRQAATNSADAGVEAAINWLSGIEAANSALNALNDTAHPFNNTDSINGYYSSMDPGINLTDGTGMQWNDADSVLVGTDGSGNTVRYIIQRMCRVENVAIKDGNCLFSSGQQDENGQEVKLPQQVCDGDGCPPAGASPQIRVTAQAVGPKNTVSYTQAFVY
ncbi:MAG: hypothetical protein C0406_02345 [Sideroxydans sp.]|nr:hypothetical protein [Sideroxydans sp.]